MQAIEEEEILANCMAMGDYLRTRLEAFKEKFAFIRDVRGRGLILGMELGLEGADLVNRAMAKGLLINCTAGNVLRFLPPLIVSREEIDEAVGILDDILATAR